MPGNLLSRNAILRNIDRLPKEEHTLFVVFFEHTEKQMVKRTKVVLQISVFIISPVT